MIFRGIAEVLLRGFLCEVWQQRQQTKRDLVLFSVTVVLIPRVNRRPTGRFGSEEKVSLEGRGFPKEVKDAVLAKRRKAIREVEKKR